MSPRVSVIVPIYNVGEYLVPCLESLDAQTLTDLEVLLVDDGSTDGSGATAELFAQHRAGWSVTHVENGGLGRARNIGLDLATGEYVAFLDADDIVPPDAYELLWHALSESGSDMACGGVLRFDGAHTRSSGLHRKAMPMTQMRTHIRRSPRLVYDTTAWNKLYRREFLNGHGLRFPEGVYYEDIPLTVPAHFLADSVDVIADAVYWWRQRQTDNLSITQRRHELKNLEDRLAAVRSVDDFLVAAGEKAGKQVHDRKVLTLDIPLFMSAMLEADGTFQTRFMQLAGEYLSRVSPQVVRRLSPTLRLKYHLVGRGLLPELLDVLRWEVDPSNRVTFRRRGLRLYAELPFLDDAALGVPRSVYDVTRSQPLRTGIRDVTWDGTDLVVEGHAFIDRIGLPTRGSALRRVQVRPVDDTGGSDDLRVRVPSRAVRRRDVTARVNAEPVSYDWSGFRSRIPLSALLPSADERSRTSELVVQVATQWARRGSALAHPEDARARHPERRLFGDVAVAVHYVDTLMRVTARRAPAVLVDARVCGEVLRLQVRGLAGRDLGGWRVHLQREDSLHGLTLSLTPADQDGVWQVEVPVEALRVQARAVSARVWRVMLAAPDATGEPAPDEEVEHAEPADAVPLDVDPAATLEAALVSGRVLGVHTYPDGAACLVEQRPEPVVEAVRLDPAEGLVLSGSVLGRAPEAFVLTHGDGTELEVPVAVDGRRWSARIPVDGEPGTAALRRLRAGRWGVTARDARESQATAVVVDERESARLAGFHRFGDHRVAVRSRTDHRLGLTIDAGGEWRDRGAFYRHRNKRYVYGLQRRAPLEDTVLFEAWKGRQLSDNPRALYEELVRRGDPRRLVWAVQDHGVEVPDGVETVVRFGRDYYRHLGRARWLVSNDSVAPHFVKREDATYLQTWHGTPLKRIGFDIADLQMANKNYLDEFAREVRKWDYLVSPNRFSTDILRRAFRYEGEVLETGYPRNDVFYRPAEREARVAAARRRLGIEPGKRVILYAPTWRDNRYDTNGRYEFDMRLDLEQLHRSYGDDSVLLVRGHQLVADRVGMGLFGGFVRNVSRYPDIADLYLLADVLITDYSSVMFDFANSGRPMLFYTWDLDAYRDDLRGFYFDFEAEAPGPLLRTSGEVVEALGDLDAVAASSATAYAAFRERFCGLEDGNASARVLDAIPPRS